MKVVTIVLAASIAITSSGFDFIVFHSYYSHIPVYRVITECSSHAAIGYLSALLFFSNGVNISTKACFYNVIFCTIVSTLIDIDHFITARSYHLKDLIISQGRGFFHCSTTCMGYIILLSLYAQRSKKLNIYLLSYMLLIAFSCHHIRDGRRRGLWLYPFGNTEPLNTYVYLISLAVMPIIFFYIYDLFKPNVKDRYYFKEDV